MSSTSIVESIALTGMAKAFYTGGEVRVGNLNGHIYSLYNGGVSVVDPESGQTVAFVASENDQIATFAVDPTNNSELITVGQSLLCRHWHISEDSEVTMVRAWSSGHSHTVCSIDISHDGSLVATSGIDKSIRVFTIQGYYSVCVYKVPTMADNISIVRFCPSRNYLATVGPENTISVYDLDQPSRLTPIKDLACHMSTVHTISFSPDGSCMYTSGNDQVVATWNTKDLTLVSQVAVFESVHSVCSFPDNGFVTVGDKGQIRLWKNRKCALSAESGHSANGELKYIFSLSLNEMLVVGQDLSMSIWNVSSTSISFSRQLLGNLGEIVSLKYLDESRVVCAVNDEFPRVINTTNFSTETKLVGHSDICLSVAVSGEYIATGSKDQTIRMWKNYECIDVLKGHTGPVTTVCFSHNHSHPKEGFRLVSGSEDTCVKVWRIADGSLKKKKSIIRSIMAHTKSVNVVAVSRNDKYIATGSQDRSAKIFDLDTGKLVGTCLGHKRGIWGVDFSPIEKIVATSSGDSTIKLWNLVNGGDGANLTCIRTFEGHDHSVLNCRFLINSGMQLVSTDAIGSMRVWNVRTGECGIVALTNGEVIESHSEKKKSSAVMAAAKAIENFTEEDDENVSRVWALDMVQTSNDGGLKICTGTASGSLVCWEDNTEKIVLERSRAKAEKSEKDTSIQVLLKSGQYHDAFVCAFELDRPKQMLEVLRESNWKNSSGGQGINVGRFVREKLGQDEQSVKKLVNMIAEWSKTSRNCSIAYALLVELARAGVSSTDSSDLRSKLECYAEKHLLRLTNLSQKCYIVDAILIAADSAVISEREPKQRKIDS